MFFPLLECRNVKLDLMVSGRKTGNYKRKNCANKQANTTIKCLCNVLKDHARHSMLYFLSSLPISVLRGLDTEANKFYDSTH